MPLALLGLFAFEPGFAAAPAADAPHTASPSGAASAGSRILRVGPRGEYRVPSAAARAARDGDTIEIASGEYRGDVAVWSANRLRIIGVGGIAHLKADGKDAEGKAIWVIRGDDTLVENIEFSDAKVANRNGAGIRFEGGKLTVRNSFFHDNEEGILTSNDPASELVIDHSEFARNGAGDGQSHNLYAGAIAKLTVRDSYFHHAVVGHNLKSRAAVSVITNSRLSDEAEGRGSCEAEFPNGGEVTMTGNVLQKGPASRNPNLVSYGAEGLSAGKHVFVAKDNTFVNLRSTGSIQFITLAPGVPQIDISGNVFVGSGGLPSGIRSKNRVQNMMPSNVDWKPEGFR